MNPVRSRGRIRIIYNIINMKNNGLNYQHNNWQAPTATCF